MRNYDTMLGKGRGLLATAALCAVLAGCGGEAGSAETSKRLPQGKPCELVTAAEVGQVVGAEDVEVEPTDEIQCQFSSSSTGSGANIIRGQDLSKMVTDEHVDLAGAEGIRLSQADDVLCGVGVRLDGDNPEQQFAVIGSAAPGRATKPACDIADEIAVVILDKLPE